MKHEINQDPYHEDRGEKFFVIDVYYDGGSLRLEPENIVLKSRQQIVVWNFHGLPNNDAPMVTFARSVLPQEDAERLRASHTRSYLGPFANLIRWNWRIVGLGNGEIPLIEDYQGYVSVLGPDLQEKASQGFKLNNARPQVIAQSVVTVSVEQGPGGRYHLTAEPERMSTCAGSPLKWDFSPALDVLRKEGYDYRPAVVFKTSDVAAPAMGPFRQVCFQHHAVIGIGLRSQEQSYHYDIVLEPYPDAVDPSTGKPLPVIPALPELDPIIDDEGYPPGGPGWGAAVSTRRGGIACEVYRVGKLAAPCSKALKSAWPRSSSKGAM